MARSSQEEEEEVRALLSRHRTRIILDLKEMNLIAVLVKNSVISDSEVERFDGGAAAPLADDATGSDEAPKVLSESEVKCSRLIDLIARNGFEKFKQFCYAIENECPQLIEDLINDRLKYDTMVDTITNSESKDDPAADSDKDTSDRSRRSLSYGGSINSIVPIAAPRKGSKTISPIPTSTADSATTPEPSPIKILEKNINQKLDPIPKLYQNNSNNNYASLLCHATSTTTSPATVRKRDKILHRFSDAATIGRRLKKKKNTNRTCRSMTEPIEVLADPVVEDDFFVSIDFYLSFNS